ncbi:MAG: hypothetical protein Q8N42_02275 [bacterium]|nr:hypothetical protein [bacterium]
MNKYAFIDVQNTDTTTKKLLGFEIDWKKLCEFLKNDWGCEKVFLYIGIDAGDFEFLIRKLNEKGTKVKIVSSGKKIKSGSRYFTSRFSTKLRNLISKNRGMVDFININNIRLKIEKK